MTEQYLPTPEVNGRRAKRYKKLQEMMELKNKPMPHFTMSDTGEQSWLSYIDNNERILNLYTPSRESQGKEDWQANGFDPITRAKLKAIAAGVGLKVPEMKYVAKNKNGIYSVARAGIMRETVRHSFLDGNPTLQAFTEVWQMFGHGVVFEYDGYLTGGAKRKVVDSYDSETGEVKWKEEYIPVDNKPINIILQPQEFYWDDMKKRDVQAQNNLAWVQRYSKWEIEQEFARYPNYKYIKNKKQLSGLQMAQDTLYYRAWADRIGEGDYEVFRFYSKEDGGQYAIYVNGVEMLDAPLLWGANVPIYPFAKTISEPFANMETFVGMAFPHLLESFGTMKTTMVNTVVDKFYRSLKKPMLVGLGNKDLLDVESELTDEDNRIYVPDVTQVKPFPFEGVSQADLAMLQAMDRYISMLSVDLNQMGMQGGGVTAREAIIADERARQLKGIPYMFLEDLWLQKNKLRVQTILTSYLKDKARRTSFKDRTITVDGVTFSDGARGTLDIHIAPSKRKLLSQAEIEAREEAMAEQGITYKLISITKDYLNEWEYDFQVIPASLYNENRIQKENDVMEKIEREATLFPEHFVANKEKRYSEMLDIYGESPEDLPPPAQPAPEQISPDARRALPTPAEPALQ